MDIVRFGGGAFFKIKGFCQEINGETFVRFTKIICMSLPHRLSIFLAFFLEFNFLALKKILNIKLTAIFLDQFVLNILYYSLYD